MKNLFTILFLTAGLFLNAQYYSITFANVPQENVAEFEDWRLLIGLRSLNII